MAFEGSAKIWWGSYKLLENQKGVWAIGPFNLCVEHLANEWKISFDYESDPLLNRCQKELKQTSDNTVDFSHISRFAFSTEHTEVRLVPIMADRPIVTKPNVPFSILPKETATVFISTPLWIKIETDSSKVFLQDIPSYRPSDTWFGTSTREGELCYASKTSCRLNSEEMPFLPHRAITAVVIHNEGSDSFLLQSVKLPVNYLSLYQSESDDLWTETVSLYRYDGDKLSRLHISKKPISSIPIKKKISGPRIKSEKNIVVKAFNAFFDKENR